MPSLAQAALALSFAVSTLLATGFDRTVYFEEVNVSLSWNLLLDKGEVVFELSAPISSGKDSWMGLGISHFGSMKGADIALIAMTSDGRSKIYDLWSEDYMAIFLRFYLTQRTVHM